MVDRPAGEETAGGQAGMAGPDDDRGDALDESALRLRWAALLYSTSTVTFTGFVMTSYTAERF